MDSRKLLNTSELLEELLPLKVGDIIRFGQTQIEIRKAYNVKTPNKIKIKYLLSNSRVPSGDVWLTIDSLFKMIGNDLYSSYSPVYDRNYRPLP